MAGKGKQADGDEAIELDDNTLDAAEGGALSYSDLKTTTTSTGIDRTGIRKAGERIQGIRYPGIRKTGIRKKGV